MKFSQVMVAAVTFVGYAFAVGLGYGSGSSGYAHAAGSSGGVGYSSSASPRVFAFRFVSGAGSESNVGGISSGGVTGLGSGAGVQNYAGGAAPTGLGGGAGVAPALGSGTNVHSGVQSVAAAASTPNQLDYNAVDKEGNSHYRQEHRDANGAVRGIYGYNDRKAGLYRVVNYVADGRGFRANIKTNEPGTDSKQSPAGVATNTKPPGDGPYTCYVQSYRSGEAGAANTDGSSGVISCQTGYGYEVAGIGGREFGVIQESPEIYTLQDPIKRC